MQSIPERILPQTVASLLAHDDDWHEQRRKGIGGSDAMKIMSGDWLTLWEEKTGRAAAQDLSDVLPVVMGAWTEPLNRYWFEKKTGMKVDLSKVGHCEHSKHSFIRANLDGRVGLGIFEAKHVNAFAKPEEVREKYYPQCQHNMAVTGTPVCYLSILIGTQKWEKFDIDEDREYQAYLLACEIKFWNLVQSDTPPPVETAPRQQVNIIDVPCDDHGPDWTAFAIALIAEIDKSPNIAMLNALIKSHNQLIAEVKAKAPKVYEHLEAATTKCRATLGQAPLQPKNKSVKGNNFNALPIKRFKKIQS